MVPAKTASKHPGHFLWDEPYFTTPAYSLPHGQTVIPAATHSVVQIDETTSLFSVSPGSAPDFKQAWTATTDWRTTLNRRQRDSCVSRLSINADVALPAANPGVSHLSSILVICEAELAIESSLI